MLHRIALFPCHHGQQVSVSPANPEVTVASLQTRVVNILKDPKSEWPVIAAESTDIGRLYREYIIPLSAIPAVAGFIGSMWLASLVHVSLMWALCVAIVSYVLGLVGMYIDAVIIEWLAPKFKSSGTRVDALKVVAYSMTPVWIAGILQLVPLLGLLAIFAALYAIYLCYLGLPPVMKTPQDQVVIFMIVAAVVIIVVHVVFAAIVTSVMWGGAATMLR
jgi:hypothetical protein